MVICCGKEYLYDDIYCSKCAKKLEHNFQIDVLDEIFDQNRQFRPKINGSGYSNESKNLRDILGLILHISREGNDLNTTIFESWPKSDTNNVKDFTNEFYKKLYKLGNIDLYYFCDNGEWKNSIYTHDEIINKLKIENEIFGLEELFTKENKFKNITIKYMTDQMSRYIGQFSLHRNIKDLIKPKLKKDMNPVKALLLIFGFMNVE